jgi:tRNA modification GTPase
VQEVRNNVLGIIARIEASIDFPEEDVPTPQAEELRPFITIALQQVHTLLAGSEQGRLYRQGLRTVILGRPNVGKSSLLNALLRSERAIVTPVAGTTRDTVEEVANLRGIPLHLIDTAGITPSTDPVEQIGVLRSRAAAESADLVLLVFDGSEPLTEQDRRVSEEVQAMGFGERKDSSVESLSIGLSSNGDQINRAQRPVILVINKADCLQRLDVDAVRTMWPGVPVVRTSMVTGTGLAKLEETVAELVLAGKTLQSESVLVTSTRHQEALRQAAEHLKASLAPLEQRLPLDFVSIDLRAAYDALGEVTGETASDDLLERIFSEFCIGK